MSMINMAIEQLSANPAFGYTVLVFIAFIAIISLIDVVIIVKKGPSNPYVDTIIEMLPVLGLLGTFIGAFTVFLAGEGHKLSGIILAFTVSAFGWFFYLILHFMRASFSNKWEESPRFPIDEARSLNTEMQHLIENAKKASIELSFVQNKLNKIYEAISNIGKGIEIKGDKSLVGEASALNLQLNNLTTNLAGVEKSLNNLHHAAEKNINVSISDSFDYDSLVGNIERLTKSLTLLADSEHQHQIDINYNSNYQNLDSTISTISRALVELNQTNQKLNIQINAPQNMDQVTNQLSELNTVLNSLDNSPKNQTINISAPSNLEDISTIFEKTEGFSKYCKKPGTNYLSFRKKVRDISIEICDTKLVCCLSC